MGTEDVVVAYTTDPFFSQLHHGPYLVHHYLLMSTSTTAKH